MDTWKVESNPAKQMIFTCGIVVVGLVLAYGFRHFDRSGFTNSLAGFLLGILLLVIGVPGLFMIRRESITVDSTTRRITIEKTNRFGKKDKIILFSEIADVSVTQLGNSSDGSPNFHVTLSLRSGKNFPLFFPAYYDGRWDRSVAEDRCRRLEKYLQQ
ncbi:MAG: hypothetical protein PHP42_04320 [Bacteroidota bacterium]|nr:hypothetical protein [Bacteroidota bacterium]